MIQYFIINYYRQQLSGPGTFSLSSALVQSDRKPWRLSSLHKPIITFGNIQGADQVAAHRPSGVASQ